MRFDIVIPVVSRNLNILPLTISYLSNNIKCNEIILLGSCAIKEKCEKLECVFLDEDELIEGMTIDLIKSIICHKDEYAAKRTGWYYQQFLKMAYSIRTSCDYYLTWDADTIPLNCINMISSEGKPIFDIKTEYHKPYFRTINSLFDNGVQKTGNYSFISEHMLFETKCMKEMIHTIESNNKLAGNAFFEKILEAVNPIDLLYSGFSEFETYGNYVETFHPGKYQLRKINSFREGDILFDKMPTQSELEWVARSYDIITIEGRKKASSDTLATIKDAISNGKELSELTDLLY